MDARTAKLRDLPPVHELAHVLDGSDVPPPVQTELCRTVLASARRHVQQGGDVPDIATLYAQLAEAAAVWRRRLLTRVINATGVLLHTNLGRAPLPDAAVEAITSLAAGYSNLEYDIDAGTRGSRHVHGEALICRLTGAEAAMVVNNNAAAVLLVLASLASGGEVILSRGEMIEIGGSFRIPEVMAQSGCRLREVGTTNRTRLADYEAAFGAETAAVLKVHPSNYRLVGFVESAPRESLARLAQSHGVPLVEDLGSGTLLATETYGLGPEPSLQQVLDAGVDVVTCSGDKLLGGPQAGLILGKKAWIDRCRRHPLARAVRVGKLTLAALQATLMLYLQGNEASVPLWRMIRQPADEIRARAEALAHLLRDVEGDVTLIDGESTLGGGSLPGETLPTVLVRITPRAGGVDDLAARLRRRPLPVVGRIVDAAYCLDLRTVDPADDAALAQALRESLATGRSVDRCT